MNLKYQLGKNIEQNKKEFRDRKSSRNDDGMMEMGYQYTTQIILAIQKHKYPKNKPIILF